MNDFFRGLPEITARISYIDTLQIWLAAPLSSEQLRILRGQCGSVRVFSESLRNRPDLKRRYLIQRPSAAALKFLLQKASYVHMINRVDIALDLTVADANAAHQLDVFFVRHKVQRWHGKRRMLAHNGTTYISRDRRTARNLVQYCDMPSKIIGGPCLHLELRLIGAEACRRAGVEFLEDLLELDHRKIWSKELCLRAVDPRKLERYLDNVVGQVMLRQPEMAEQWRATMGGHVTRRDAAQRCIKAILANTLSIEGMPEIHADTLHLAPAQRWVEARPGYARRCLIPLPSEHFLPDNSRHIP